MLTYCLLGLCFLAAIVTSWQLSAEPFAWMEADAPETEAAPPLADITARALFTAGQFVAPSMTVLPPPGVPAAAPPPANDMRQ